MSSVGRVYLGSAPEQPGLLLASLVRGVLGVGIRARHVDLFGDTTPPLPIVNPCSSSILNVRGIQQIAPFAVCAKARFPFLPGEFGLGIGY